MLSLKNFHFTSDTDAIPQALSNLKVILVLEQIKLSYFISFVEISETHATFANVSCLDLPLLHFGAVFVHQADDALYPVFLPGFPSSQELVFRKTKIMSSH